MGGRVALTETASPGFRAEPSGVYAFLSAFWEELAAGGLAGVCVSPGSRSTPLTIAADRVDDLPLRVLIDERSAAFFALGWAKAARAPIALVCTSGTAAANYLPAIVEAHYAGVPLVVLTADRPAELRGWGAGQTIEQVGLYGPYVRYAVEVPVPVAGDDALRFATSLAARTLAETMGTLPGPVHVNWPLREPLPPPFEIVDSRRTLPLDASKVRGLSRSTMVGQARPGPTREDVSSLAELAAVGVKGVISCGPMDEGAGFAAGMAKFARISGWPILADGASQLRRGPHVEDAPLIGGAEALMRDSEFTDSHRPDVVLRFGATPVSKALRRWIADSRPQTYWWIDDRGVEWSDPDHLTTRVSRCDPSVFVTEVLAELEPAEAPTDPRSQSWLQEFVRANDRTLTRQAERFRAAPELLEAGVVRELALALPDEALLYVSNSMPVRHLDAFLEVDPRPLRVLANRGASGIDGLSSCALGAAEAGRGPVVLLTGDLAFLHDVGGLLAARDSAPVVFVVLNNDGGDIFSHLPIAAQTGAAGFEKLFRTPHGLSFENAAGLYGLAYERIAGVEHFRTAMKSVWGRSRSTVLEIPIDAERSRAQYLELLQ